MHFKHVPATVSICSNVHGHTNALHIRSNGDAQQPTDNFITELLNIQAVRERLITAKYQPIIDALKLKELVSKKKLEEEEEDMVVEEEQGESQDEENTREESEEEVEEVQTGGRKRKRKMSRKQRQVGRKRAFRDDEAQLSGDDDDDDDDRGSDGNDIEGLIYDSSDVERITLHFIDLSIIM